MTIWPKSEYQTDEDDDGGRDESNEDEEEGIGYRLFDEGIRDGRICEVEGSSLGADG